MILNRRTAALQQRDRFIAEATKHLGYRTRPGGLSDFGARVGYNGHDIPWSGAFIDVVARDSGTFIPACVYTPSGLAEFIYSRRWRETPQVGDVVFYSFPTAGAFGMPHVGIVSGLVGDFMQTGYFLAIEGQVSSGLPRDDADRLGVFERRRWKHEVLGFARPDFREPRPGKGPKMQTGSLLVRFNRVRPGRGSSDIETVQLALTQVAGLKNHEPRVLDRPTRDAFARWQRMIGRVGSDASGVPDPSSLERLGRDTGLFELKSEN